MKTLTTIIAALIVFSVTSLNAMTPPSTNMVEQSIMKQAIDSKLDYQQAAKALDAEGTVELTVEINNKNEMQVTYIDGNAELSDYVQANIDNLEITRAFEVSGSYNFELEFKK